MALSKDKLLELANIIRYERSTGQNTAERVGGTLVEIINAMGTGSGSGGIDENAVRELIKEYLKENGGISDEELDKLLEIKFNNFINTRLGALLNLKLDKNIFDNAFIPVDSSLKEMSWDETLEKDYYAIKTKKGFYSESFISCLGANANGSSGGGGSGSYLSGLTGDVRITNPQDGQTLVYRNGYWVNETGGSGGINSSELSKLIHNLTFAAGSFSAKTYNPLTNDLTVNIPSHTSHLTNDSDFITAAKVANDYVKKAGDTMTGTLYSSATNAFQLYSGNYGVILRRSEADMFHIIPTASGSPTGDIGSLRPFSINLQSGLVSMNHGIKIGEATIKWDSEKLCLIVDKGFASESFISCLGVNPDGAGSVGGGVSKLSQLEDVRLNATSIKNGQALVYRDGYWVNETVSAGLTSVSWSDIKDIPGWIGSSKPSYSWGEINEKPSWIGASKPTYIWSEILSKPTTLSGFGITDAYTKTQVDNNFVKKSGDTMTGKLTVNSDVSVSGSVHLGNNLRFYKASGKSMYFEVNTDGRLNFCSSTDGNFTGINSYLTNDGSLWTRNSIKIGDATITWNSNGYLVVDKGFVSESFISCLGVNSGAAGGGETLTFTTSGTGNAVTSVSKSGTTVTFSKGLTFATEAWVNAKGYLTAHQSLANYVTLSTAQTISGVKTFSNGFKLNTDTSWTSSDRGIPFSANDDFSLIKYYNDNTNTGLTFNPNTGALKAGSFVKRGGSSTQFLKADGSVDSNSYLLTTGNAASASKLYTARTLWGQSFNGTANVSGDMTDVGTISAKIAVPSSGTWYQAYAVYCEGLTQDKVIALRFGKNDGTANSGLIGHYHKADGSNKNGISFAGWNYANLMFIEYDGNVGIGTTSPSEKLTVAGNIVPNATNSYNLGSTSYYWQSVYSRYLTSDGTLYLSSNSTSYGIYFRQGSTTRMYLGTNGLGIGTTSPSAKLHVVGDSNMQTILPTANNNYSLGNYSYRWSGIYGVNGYFSGKVGIGTSSPSYTLHIVGDCFCNSFYINNNLKFYKASGNSQYLEVNSDGRLNFCTSTNGSYIATRAFLTWDGTFYVNNKIIVANNSTASSATAGSIQIGKATISWDNLNQCLKVDSGMYSESFISALGINRTGIDGDITINNGRLVLYENAISTYGYIGAVGGSYIGLDIYSVAQTLYRNIYLCRPGGNVGIGTSSISAKLHVNGTFYASGATSLGNTLTVSGNTILNGNVAIGQNSINNLFKLYIVGAVAATGAVNQNYTSDLRLKTDIDTNIDCITVLLKLGNVFTYRYTSQAVAKRDWLDSTTLHTGIAYQNAVNAMIPNFTGTDEQGYGWVNFLSNDYQATLLGAFIQTALSQKSMQNDVNWLKNEVRELRKENQDLKQRVKELEKEREV